MSIAKTGKIAYISGSICSISHDFIFYCSMWFVSEFKFVSKMQPSARSHLIKSISKYICKPMYAYLELISPDLEHIVNSTNSTHTYTHTRWIHLQHNFYSYQCTDVMHYSEFLRRKLKRHCHEYSLATKCGWIIYSHNKFGTGRLQWDKKEKFDVSDLKIKRKDGVLRLSFTNLLIKLRENGSGKNMAVNSS